jgi:hypothetical protein
MRHLLFAASLAALPALGFGAASHRSVRSLFLPARVGAALALGSVALTITALLLSTAGIPWSVAALSVPPLALSLVLRARWRRETPEPGRRFSPSRPMVAASATAGGLGLAHLSVALATASATSTDFLLFWGVKAARFAQARAVDVALLRWPYFAHAVPDYPPAVPILQAWSALWTGELPWRLVPVTTAVWAAAAAPLLLALLRRRLDDDGALAVTGFWVAALSISLAHALSGGNAEAPLLFFETLAVAALLVEPAGGSTPPSRFLPSLMLAGAALTKVEGSVAVLVIVAGTLARDFAEPRRRRSRSSAAPIAAALRLLAGPAAAVSCWFAFQAIHGLRVGYRGHGDLFALHAGHLPEILGGMLTNLGAGTAGLSWAIPLLLLLHARPDPRALAPALALTGGLLLFLAFDYLHDENTPSERIHWTTPRVSQPALSALILAAGIATGGRTASRGD